MSLQCLHVAIVSLLTFSLPLGGVMRLERRTTSKERHQLPSDAGSYATLHRSVRPDSLGGKQVAWPPLACLTESAFRPMILDLQTSDCIEPALVERRPLSRA